MPIEIVHFILLAVLGPANYHKGIEFLKTVHGVPSLIQLLDTILAANRFGILVKIDSDLILKGMDELRRVLDQGVESNRNLTEQQIMAYKSGNAWFVNECYTNLMARCVVLRDQ
ncbi:MAG: hypothetical protein J6Q22_03030 [Prevotella sp.]|nr:hypothetical protein [Prevotella sp.]